MAKKPITLGHLHFSKKGDALLFYKNILNQYSPGDRVSDEDAEALSLALANHPDAADKIGSGIDFFSVDSADFGTQCFFVHRSDGTKVRFSYKSCLD